MSAGIVGLTAGLRTQTAVAAAPADDGAHIALTGITHAQSSVAEYLQLDGGEAAEFRDFIRVQFSGEADPAEAHGGAHLDALQIVDAHLRAAVKFRAGKRAPQSLDQA